MLAAIYHKKFKMNKHRARNYIRFLSNIGVKERTFPVDIKRGIDKFEKLNHIKVF